MICDHGKFDQDKIPNKLTDYSSCITMVSTFHCHIAKSMWLPDGAAHRQALFARMDRPVSFKANSLSSLGHVAGIKVK